MIFRRLTKLGIATATVGLALTSVAPAAHAVPGPNGVKENLALVGSDATEHLMTDLASGWNGDHSFNSDPDKGQEVDSAATDPPVTIKDCASPPPLTGGVATYPNGSSQGITALNQVAPFNQGDACYDIARSTRNRSNTDLATDEFYGFGGDAIVPLYWVGTHGPGATGYTDAELTAIYTNCSIVTWADLGAMFGIPGLTSTDKIITFSATVGSGASTSADGFFSGGPSAVTNCTTGKNKPIIIPENDATQVTTAQQPDAVYYDSYGSFKDPTRKSLKNHAKMAKVQNEVDNTTFEKASPTTILSGAFPYRRYIFNVIRTTQTSYSAALRFVGFDDTAPGYLCNANNTSVASTITTDGFVPLAKTVQTLPDGTKVKTTCRKNPPPLVEGSSNPL